jgi:hypothetical protein
VTFAPADHVTQREDGPWRDCTWASMLETLRLALPDGAGIPADQPEVERFRAAGGYPDNHTGVTIEETIPAAKSRYGLRDDQYSLTRDWPTLAAALADPSKVCVVTGKMSGVPESERVTSFTGNHAVAKHGVLIRCDPLGPADGHYVGNVWSLTLWRSFTSALGYWQALIMEARGDDGMIAAGGITLTSNKTIRATVATPALDAPGGKPILTMKAGAKVAYMGNASGHRVGLFSTGIPYPDKVTRPTYLYVAIAAVVVEDAPPAPTVDVTHTFAASVDGVVKWKETI